MEAYRGCPDGSDIGAYLEGKLPLPDRECLEKHLGLCEACRVEVALAGRIIREGISFPEGDAPETLKKKVIGYHNEETSLFDAVIAMAMDALKVLHVAGNVTLFLPAHATALRHTRVIRPDMVVLTRSFGAVDVECDIEKVTGNLCNIKATVLVSPSGDVMRDGRIELLSEGRILASYSSERDGVVFDDVPPGKYSIRILRRGETCGIMNLRIE